MHTGEKRLSSPEVHFAPDVGGEGGGEFRRRRHSSTTAEIKVLPDMALSILNFLIMGCILSHAAPVRATMKVLLMAILYRYLRHFWKLGAAALALAAINQIFSLLDPLIFRHIIDSYATRYKEYSIGQFLRGVSVLLGAAMGVAFISQNCQVLRKSLQKHFAIAHLDLLSPLAGSGC